MTLIGPHVTQYMYVLFDEVHIYIQKSQFTLLCSVVPKHPVILQRATSIYRNTHNKQLLKDTSVMHGILDPLLLNATAVSDFPKTLRKKRTMQ